LAITFPFVAYDNSIRNEGVNLIGKIQIDPDPISVTASGERWREFGSISGPTSRDGSAERVCIQQYQPLEW
jgi:hypothetical protein